MSSYLIEVLHAEAPRDLPPVLATIVKQFPGEERDTIMTSGGLARGVNRRRFKFAHVVRERERGRWREEDADGERECGRKRKVGEIKRRTKVGNHVRVLPEAIGRAGGARAGVSKGDYACDPLKGIFASERIGPLPSWVSGT